MIYTIFDAETGVIEMTLDTPDLETLGLNVPQGSDYLPGEFDASTVYIRDGIAVMYPASPGSWGRWDGSAWTDPRSPADKLAALYAARDATSMDRSELLIRMVMAGILPTEDAEIAAAGIIPPTIQSALDALPPEVFPPDAQMVARIKWRSDNVISRVNPVIVLAAEVLGVTDAQMDEIFNVQIPE